MKVILLKDVPKVGKKYDVCDASNGFARNFLIARGLAELATDKNINRVGLSKKQNANKDVLQKNLLLKNIAELEGKEFLINGKANDKGHLFAGIHKEEIASAIKSQSNIDVPINHIELESPIKEVGKFELNIKVDSKKVNISVKIEAL